MLLDAMQDRHAIGPGHHVIEQDGVIVALCEFGLRFSPIPGCFAGVPIIFKESLEQGSQGRIIIDHENMFSQRFQDRDDSSMSDCMASNGEDLFLNSCRNSLISLLN